MHAHVGPPCSTHSDKVNDYLCATAQLRLASDLCASQDSLAVDVCFCKTQERLILSALVEMFSFLAHLTLSSGQEALVVWSPPIRLAQLAAISAEPSTFPSSANCF